MATDTHKRGMAYVVREPGSSSRGVHVVLHGSHFIWVFWSVFDWETHNFRRRSYSLRNRVKIGIGAENGLFRDKSQAGS